MSNQRNRRAGQQVVEQLDDPESRIPGLRVVRDFITKEEEEQLINVCVLLLAAKYCVQRPIQA
jgi:hypothetical protein